MNRRSRVTTIRLAVEDHARLKAFAAARGISLSEVIRRMTVRPPEECQAGHDLSPAAWLDGDAFAAELRALEMQVESLTTVVEKKLGNHDRLIAGLADQTSAISALATAVQAQTLSMERLTKALYRRE